MYGANKAVLLPMGNVAAGASDPYWSSVVALIGNENGTNNSTTFTDQSATGLTLTANGDIKWSNAQAPTGMTTSIMSDGTGDYLSAAYNSALALGTGDFTVEGWIRVTTKTVNYPTFVGQYLANSKMWGMNIDEIGDLYAYIAWSNSGYASRSQNSSTGTWYHVAFVRSGNTGYIFVNGSGGTTTSLSAANFVPDSTRAIQFAFALTTTNGLASTNGHFGPIRITKGVARYTANFTPPTLPLPTH